MAVARFLCWLRSFWQATTIPVGPCVRRTADSVLLTCWPPAPLERYTSILMSAGFRSILMSSSTSGDTNTEANEVWRRLPESNGDLRTRRCTPVSVRSQPYAYSPLTSMVALLMPATSPACESNTSASKPRDAAHLRYMRSSICAQSCASVPPAPAWISRKALCESISPRYMRLNSSLRTSASSLAASRSISRAMDSSSSLSASSSSSAAEVTAPVASSMSTRSMVRRARSLPSSWAFSGFCQMAVSSSSRLTSSSRSFFWSYSKKPPQGVHTLLEIFELPLQLSDFKRHRGDRQQGGRASYLSGRSMNIDSGSGL